MCPVALALTERNYLDALASLHTYESADPNSDQGEEDEIPCSLIDSKMTRFGSVSTCRLFG
jgi:hypothetical protein